MVYLFARFIIVANMLAKARYSPADNQLNAIIIMHTRVIYKYTYVRERH